MSPRCSSRERVAMMIDQPSAAEQTPMTWCDGHLIPSDRPGLGHDLDEDVAREYAIR